MLCCRYTPSYRKIVDAESPTAELGRQGSHAEELRGPGQYGDSSKIPQAQVRRNKSLYCLADSAAKPLTVFRGCINGRRRRIFSRYMYAHHHTKG